MVSLKASHTADHSYQEQYSASNCTDNYII